MTRAAGRTTIRTRLQVAACLAVGSLLVACGNGGSSNAGSSPDSERGGDASNSAGTTPPADSTPTTGSSVPEQRRFLLGPRTVLERRDQSRLLRPRTRPVLGADISWPQCPKGLGIPEKRTLGLPMPIDDAEYIVVGLTNGPGFVRNPCLADQVDWVRNNKRMISAYAVGSYPDASTVDLHGGNGPFDGGSDSGRLSNTGYQQALYNVEAMRETGLRTPVVWIDVEPVPTFEWSADLEANAAVVRGLARGYRDQGYRIGIYSTPHLWQTVVGDFSLGGVPEWRAAGQTSRTEALSRCSRAWSVQGGPAVMGQWVADNRDHNLTCPGISQDLGRWFHAY